MTEAAVDSQQPHLAARLWRRADGARRKQALLLVALMLISTLLDVVGIGAVLPIVALLTGEVDFAGEWAALPPRWMAPDGAVRPIATSLRSARLGQGSAVLRP